MERPVARGPSRRRRAFAAASLLLLLAPSTPALAQSSSSSFPASFLDGRYGPSADVASDVDAFADLDLDLRSMSSALASSDGGLGMARTTYEAGTGDGSTEGDGTRQTLQGLSTRVDQVITVGSPTYATFKEYYGRSDYADAWVRAAFDGTETEFDDGGGNYDFGEFDPEARGAAVKNGILALNVWMGVVGRLEEASNLCVTIADEDDLLVDEWDRAVALYTGSLARTDGRGGYMLYTLAQVECAEFGTCAPGDMAPANDRILDAFNDGRAHLRQGNCNDVAEKANDVRSLMTVPLIQGTLRAMHALDKQERLEDGDAQGRGAAFAAALLPLVHGCGPGNALILHNDLSPGKILTGDYDVVRAALERSYECLGVTCADVGGILNNRLDGYAKGAEACGNVRPVVTGVDYDDVIDATTSGTTVGSGDETAVGPGDETTVGPGDEEDDLFEYEDYAYFEGKGESDTMDPVTAALISGLSFGTCGFIIGAAITCMCKAKKKKKKEHSEVEFVASRNGNGTANGTGNGVLVFDEDEVI